MDETQLTDFLKGRSPIFSDRAIWDEGNIELEINYYLSDEIPPVDFISSVRAIVFKGGEVLVIEEAESEFHIIPGGRREAGETLEETVHREVGEESGWTIQDLEPFAFAHLQHTTPMPENYPFLYPHFIWLIYKAQAVDYRSELMFSAEQLVEEYVIGSKFIPIRQAVEKLSKRDSFLIDAELKLRSALQKSIDRIRHFNQVYKYGLPNKFIDAIDSDFAEAFLDYYSNFSLEEIYGCHLNLDHTTLVQAGSKFEAVASATFTPANHFLFRLQWDGKENTKIKLIGKYIPFDKQSFEILMGGFARQLASQDMFSQDALHELVKALGEQFESATTIELEQNPFQFIPEEKEPEKSENHVQFVEGDLVGPDNHGISTAVVWCVQKDSKPPYSLKSLQKLKSNRFFSWTSIIEDDYFKERYLDSEGSQTWEIDGLSCELSWYKWHELPDLILQFWTSQSLSVDALKKAENLFLNRLLENMKQSPERFKEYCFHPEVAEQGYAKYFSGFKEHAPGHYSMHADLSVCENEIITWWIRSLDSLHADFGVNKIRVGSN